MQNRRQALQTMTVGIGACGIPTLGLASPKGFMSNLKLNPRVVGIAAYGSDWVYACRWEGRVFIGSQRRTDSWDQLNGLLMQLNVTHCVLGHAPRKPIRAHLIGSFYSGNIGPAPDSECSGCDWAGSMSTIEWQSKPERLNNVVVGPQWGDIRYNFRDVIPANFLDLIISGGSYAPYWVKAYPPSWIEPRTLPRYRQALALSKIADALARAA